MPRLDPSAAAAKWVRRAQAASADYADGVRGVTRAPGAAAAAKANKALAGYQDAIQSGRWSRNVQAVGLAEWQERTATVGAPRYAQGVAASGDKMQAAMSRVFPMIQQAQAAIANMDDSTIEARIARAAAFQRAMHEQSRQRRT